MNRNRMMIIWLSLKSTSPFIFSIHLLFVYILVGSLLVSWMLLGVGVYLRAGLYRDWEQLRKENVYLRGKKKDLDMLRLTMRRIQRDEEIIRGFMGMEGRRVTGESLGQGGTPADKISSIVGEHTAAKNDLLFPVRAGTFSLMDEATILRENLQELVETMREQRQLLDSTPSIVPVGSDHYWFSSGFGRRRSPFTGLPEFHDGLDIAASAGTPIIAPANGKVIKTAFQIYRGKYLQLDHGWGYVSTYAHLSSFHVTIGQKVKRGEVIAFMGSTGRSTNPHLHYEIEIDGRAVDPVVYILNAKVNRLLGSSRHAEGFGQ